MGWALFRDRLPRWLVAGKQALPKRALSSLERLHGGDVGDYAARLPAGAAWLGELFAVALRR